MFVRELVRHFVFPRVCALRIRISALRGCLCARACVGLRERAGHKIEEMDSENDVYSSLLIAAVHFANNDN